MKSFQGEKKKKRDKPTAHGAELGMGEQPPPPKQADSHKRLVEAEQRTMEAVNTKKPLLSTSPSRVTAGLPYTSHLYPPLPQWPFTPHQQGQMCNQSTQPPHFQMASMQSLPLQGQQQQQQQGQVQQPYWNTSDYSAQAAAAGHYYPFPPCSSDSNWPPPAFASFQASSNAPFGFPGSYGFPGGGVVQVGFPGPWDPSSWYGQQSAAGYAPAYRAYYGYGAPGGTVGVGGLGISGTVQKGLIKPPPGLSHKHQRLWEAQSVENMQIWATLGRAEAEITAQHSKILQLEADLQSLKSHQEAPRCIEVTAAAPSQPSKRVRQRKRTFSCPEGVMYKPKGRKPSDGKTMPILRKGDKSDLNSHEETATKADELNNCTTAPGFTKDENVNCSLLIDMLKSVGEKSMCPEMNVELGSVKVSDPLFSNNPLSETIKNEAIRYSETNPSHLDGNKDNADADGNIKQVDVGTLTKPLIEADSEKDAGSDSRQGATAVNGFSLFYSHIPVVKVDNVLTENAMPSWGFTPGDASDEQGTEQEDDEDEDDEYALPENQEAIAKVAAATGNVTSGFPELNGWKNL